MCNGHRPELSRVNNQIADSRQHPKMATYIASGSETVDKL